MAEAIVAAVKPRQSPISIARANAGQGADLVQALQPVHGGANSLPAARSSITASSRPRRALTVSTASYSAQGRGSGDLVQT
jgi:hypothetical protein